MYTLTDKRTGASGMGFMYICGDEYKNRCRNGLQTHTQTNGHLQWILMYMRGCKYDNRHTDGHTDKRASAMDFNVHVWR